MTTAPRILKYKLPFLWDNTGIVNIEMPQTSSPLHVALQNGEIHVWALVADSGKKRTERFRMYGTGQPIEGVNALGLIVGSVPRYLGTVHQGDLVWHVFHEPRAASVDALLGKGADAQQESADA